MCMLEGVCLPGLLSAPSLGAFENERRTPVLLVTRTLAKSAFVASWLLEDTRIAAVSIGKEQKRN